jgi:hypothetical protein
MKYEYGTILQIIIQLIYFKVCIYLYKHIYVYRICSNRTWGQLELGTILQLIYFIVGRYINIYIYIFTTLVLTEHEGNMNMGQYYI